MEHDKLRDDLLWFAQKENEIIQDRRQFIAQERKRLKRDNIIFGSIITVGMGCVIMTFLLQLGKGNKLGMTFWALIFIVNIYSSFKYYKGGRNVRKELDSFEQTINEFERNIKL